MRDGTEAVEVRDAVIIRDRAVSVLREPASAGVCLVAPGAIGLPDLARETCAAAGIDKTMRVVGNRSLSEVAYGALAPFLGPILDTPDPDALTALSGFRGEIERRRQGAPFVIIVEQVELLDSASAGLLAQISIEAWVHLMILAPGAARIPRDLRALLLEGQLVEFSMTSLSTDGVIAFAHSRLDGIVPWVVADRFVRMGGAAPQILEGGLRESVRTGALVSTEGVWRFVDEPRLGSASVWQLRGMLAQLGPAETDALCAVALAFAIPANLLGEIFGGEAVRVLRAAELLVSINRDGLDEAGEELLRIPTNLIAVVLRESLSPSASRTLWQQVFARLPLPRLPESTLRYVEWTIECGGVVDTQSLGVLATLANRVGRPELALRAVALDRETPRSTAMQVQRARAHFYLGESVAALQIIDEIFIGPGSLNDIQRIATLLAQIYVTTGQGFDRIEVMLDRWTTMAEGTNYHGVLAQHAWALRAPAFLMISGDYRAARAAVEPLLQRSGRINAETVLTGALTGEILAVTGDFERSLEQLESALELVMNTAELANYGGFLFTRIALVQCSYADWERQDRLLERLAEEQNAWMIRQGVVVELLRAVQNMQEGDFEAGARHSQAAVVLARESDPERLRPLVLATAAFTAVVCQDLDLAAAYLAEYATLEYGGTPLTDTLTRAYASYARYLVDPSLGLDELRAVAREAGEQGHYPGRVQILLLLMDLGDRECLDEMTEITEGVSDRMGRAARALAQALRTGLACDFVDAAEIAIECSQHYIAARALTSAFLALRVVPERALHRRALDALALLAPSARALDPMLNAMREATVLSDREREVARLVARGLTSREIARALSLSDRTVEGHVQRVLLKLGLGSRERLLDANLGFIGDTA